MSTNKNNNQICSSYFMLPLNALIWRVGRNRLWRVSARWIDASTRTAHGTNFAVPPALGNLAQANAINMVPVANIYEPPDAKANNKFVPSVAEITEEHFVFVGWVLALNASFAIGALPRILAYVRQHVSIKTQAQKMTYNAYVYLLHKILTKLIFSSPHRLLP